MERDHYKACPGDLIVYMQIVVFQKRHGLPSAFARLPLVSREALSDCEEYSFLALQSPYLRSADCSMLTGLVLSKLISIASAFASFLIEKQGAMSLLALTLQCSYKKRRA